MKRILFTIGVLATALSSARAQAGEAPLTGDPKLVETTTTTTGVSSNGETSTSTTTTKPNADGSTTTTADPAGSTITYTTTTTTTQRFSDGSSVVKQPDGKIIVYGPGEGPTEPEPERAIIDDGPTERAIIDDGPTEPMRAIIVDPSAPSPPSPPRAAGDIPVPGPAPTINSSFQLSLDEADNKTAGVPKPSEETQKVEEKKSSWWGVFVPALIPEIGIGGGREDRERRFPDDPRR